MRYRMIGGSTILVLAALSLNPLHAFDLENYRLVDLSHSYGESTLYWPTSPTSFEKKTLAYGDSGEGYFYSAYTVCTPEHGGTHIDAPVHFAVDGISTAQIALDRLIAPAVVIDVSGQAEKDRNYRVSVDDVTAFETANGEIAAGTIVLVRTDWSRHWPNPMDYLGDDTAGDASNLQFPGYGADAVRLLTEERNVAMIGIDTASVDYGKSLDFIVHRIGAAQGVSNLENLTNLSELPAVGSLVIALPMKIEGGSGGPARVVALVPR
ncbi:MAG: cyclase family protein [Proteobacteria bacterium]|nr:cyclase family protein [Pseudomonadota bacterium]MDA0993473.1 cyclase family protein [Pseudomonadota bacterium]